MQRITPIILLCLLLLVFCGAVPAREITDMAGRTLTIPDEPTRVYSPSPPGLLMLYTLNPDVLCTFMPFLRGSGDNALLDARVRDLPNIGFLSGESALANLEVLMKINPDLIVMFPADRNEIENFAIQNRVIAAIDKLNVPYIYAFSKDLREYPAAYELYGAALGLPERGRQLADYIRGALADAERVVAQVPPEQRPKVYYAAGVDGLSTISHESNHAVILKLAGNVGVHRDQGALLSTALPPHDRISLEQVLEYDPDVIVAVDPLFFQHIFTSPAWSQLRAVKNQQVYLTPRAPFNWFDLPPSFMQALGLKWMLNILYPVQYDIDIVAEAVDFYRLFLWADVPYAEMQRIIYPFEKAYAN